MAQNRPSVRKGVYEVDYFTGSQCSIYIGDVFIDEAYSIEYSVSQEKQPIYGYSSTYFDGVTEGPVLVQGALTLNFKEAGYLWLVLNHVKGQSEAEITPFTSSALANRQNIESILEGELSQTAKADLVSRLSSEFGATTGTLKSFENKRDPRRSPENLLNEAANARLLGYSSIARASGTPGRAENLFETFEDMAWGSPQAELDQKHRRADDPILNGFDLFVTFGDFNGDNSVNHTVQKISNVHILGQAKVVEANGQPILETYQFLARNVV